MGRGRPHGQVRRRAEGGRERSVPKGSELGRFLAQVQRELSAESGGGVAREDQELYDATNSHPQNRLLDRVKREALRSRGECRMRDAQRSAGREQGA